MPDYLIVFAVLIVLIAASAIGMGLHAVLAERQKSRETVEHVRLVISILVTFTALVLSLLISNVKGSFDDFDSRLRAFAADLTDLDVRLREYGEDLAGRAAPGGRLSDLCRYRGHRADAAWRAAHQCRHGDPQA